MDSKSSSSAVLFLSLNILFFTMASACGTCYTPTVPTPYHPKPTPSTPTPNPKPHPTPSPSHKDKCPRDTLKLGVCATLLGGPISLVIGNPPNHPCCTLISGLVDAEAALCLCTALKANVIGIQLNVDVALSLLINTCGKKLPSGFQCA